MLSRRLSFQETNILKGLSIIAIVLHNFIHATNKLEENEWQFSLDDFLEFTNYISADPISTYYWLISYWGFYPIVIFLFISAYGLSVQESSNPSSSYVRYIRKRLVKLYALVLFGLVLYIVHYSITQGFDSFYNVKRLYKTLFKKLIMWDNVSYKTLTARIDLGSWWFMSLILQLYIIFPLLYRFVQKYKEKGVCIAILLSYVLIYALWQPAENARIPIFANFLGHLPEFILGIGFACCDKMKMKKWHIILAVVVFGLSNVYTWFYPLTFLSATVLLLALFKPFVQHSSAKVSTCLAFIGSVSMYMFITNSALRRYTLHCNIEDTSAHLIFLQSLLHLAFVVAFSYGMYLSYDHFLKKLVNRLAGE